MSEVKHCLLILEHYYYQNSPNTYRQNKIRKKRQVCCERHFSFTPENNNVKWIISVSRLYPVSSLATLVLQIKIMANEGTSFVIFTHRAKSFVIFYLLFIGTIIVKNAKCQLFVLFSVTPVWPLPAINASASATTHGSLNPALIPTSSICKWASV